MLKIVFFFKILCFLFFPCVFEIRTIKQKLPEIQFCLLGLVFNAQIQSWSNVFFKNFLWGYFWPKQKSHDFFFWFSLNFPKPKFQNLLHPFKNGSDSQECITDPWSYFVYLLSSLSPVCSTFIFSYKIFFNSRHFQLYKRQYQGNKRTHFFNPSILFTICSLLNTNIS